jgi:hypothetical protein
MLQVARSLATGARPPVRNVNTFPASPRDRQLRSGKHVQHNGIAITPLARLPCRIAAP